MSAASSSAANLLSAAKPSAGPISGTLAEFAVAFTLDAVPAIVRERAKYLMLDAIGIALASTRFGFARQLLEGVQSLADGGGDCSVIGFSGRLPLRDAVLMNGMLIHGLDFDDTHLGGAIHPTASALPCALGLAQRLDLSGRDVLAAHILGVETATRIGMASAFGFHHFGFHPTGVVGHFSCALQAAWLLRLDVKQTMMAQGIVGSTAAASQEFLSDGAWNKRMHPGWAGVGGITAAYLARSGFVGATETYEGRFGLFRSHLHERESEVDYGKMTSGLGEVWETLATAVKPYPICHFIHASADAALAVSRKYDLRADEIARIVVLLPKECLEIVAEPRARKLAPASSYDVQFSAPFVVAACFVRGRFGLAELQEDVRCDAAILSLAAKVTCAPDPGSRFPQYYSGGVVVTTVDGRELRHLEPINRGAGDRALANDEIGHKFQLNAQMAMSDERASAIRDAILGMETATARELAGALSA